jgi:RHS repeat-associated protein
MGVTYYTYRWYDPVTGRWPSRDPIKEIGHQKNSLEEDFSSNEKYVSRNDYEFARNNPAVFVDADGRAIPLAIPAGIGIWELITAAVIGGVAIDTAVRQEDSLVGGLVNSVPSIRGLDDYPRDRGSDRSKSRRKKRGCTAQEIGRLQRHMHSICDDYPPNSCDCSMSCDQLSHVMRKIEACIVARRYIQRRCHNFKPDQGHKDALSQKINSYWNCRKIQVQNGCVKRHAGRGGR